MKRFIIFLMSFALLVLITSCNRQMNRQKKETVVTVKSEIEGTVSSTIKTELIKETTTVFGDTLNGSLHFDSSECPASDSLESNGIKVKGSLVKTKSGYKLNINAVSKPAYKTDKITEKTESKTDSHFNKSIISDSLSTTTDKKVKTKSNVGEFVFIFWIVLVAVILLALWRFLKTYLPLK